MTNTWRIAIVASLLAIAAACSRSHTKAEQLAALESAYQSGVFTKAEYEAKKTALLGPATTPPPTPTAPAPTPPTPASAKPPPEVAIVPKNPPAVNEPDPEPSPSGGCDDPEYKSRKKGAQERFFPVPVARVKKAAADALKALDFTIHKNTRNEMEASKKRHISVLIGAGGEKVFLRFEESQQRGQKGTRMIGETKKSFVGRAAQKSWISAVLAQTACLLKDGR